MKNKEIRQIQVGAFMALGFIVTVLIIFLLGSENKIFQRQYTLVSYFDDISGLRLGADIQLAGINVGTVSMIAFEDDLKSKKVKLEFLIVEDYQERIRKDSKATIVTQGLLGDKMIFLSVGSPEAEVIKEGGVIQSEAPKGIGEIISGGTNVLEKADISVAHINDILKELKEGKGLVHELIYGKKGQNIMSQADDMTRNVSQASLRLESILTKIDQGEGTLGALVNDASVFNDIKTLLGKANRNKLIRAVIRETLKTRDEQLINKEAQSK